MIYGHKLDDESRRLHAEFVAGKMTREEYRECFDNLYDRLPESVLHYLRFRKDHRSLGEFALNIYDSTRRERRLIDKWNNKNNCGLKIESLGTEDSGLVIFDKARLSSRADYVVYDGDETYGLEIKYCPVMTKLTYKVKDLRAYIEDRALVLTFIGDSHWMLMGPELMQKLLDVIPAKPRREMGGKMAVQILSKDFEKFLDIQSWKA